MDSDDEVTPRVSDAKIVVQWLLSAHAANGGRPLPQETTTQKASMTVSATS
jgi:hypothetical protein